MIIGLLTLAYLIFGGGSQTFLLNPELKKDVAIYVSDKNRKTEIYQLIKEVGKNQENFEKQTKKVFNKKLVALNMNRVSTTADFLQEYDKFYDSLKGLQNVFLGSEIKIRTLILPNEWDSIMNKVLKQPDPVKARKNLHEQNLKLYNKLLAACNKYIPDSAGKKKAKSYADGYKIKGDTLANAFLNLNYQYIKTLRPYKVSHADFEPMRAQMIELRRNYTNYLVEMRFKLMTITPIKEWEGLAKELNNNFVYLGAGISK